VAPVQVEVPDLAMAEAPDAAAAGVPAEPQLEADAADAAPVLAHADPPRDDTPADEDLSQDPSEGPAEPAGPTAVASAPPPLQVRPVPGSRADLKLRLERLPLGHPSSPYHVDGERKPSPPRLKHLELAPPGPERAGGVHASASVPRFGEPDADAISDTFAPQDPARDGADVESTSTMPAITDALTASAPERSPSPHAAEPAQAALRPNLAPAGPRLAEDGSWTWGPARLTRDQVRIAEDAHDRFREAEGRNLFGSYHDEGLTARLHDIAQQLERGSLAPGTEEQALLPPDRFKARLADMLRRHPERHAEQLALRVPGALSYSFVIDAEDYADGIWLVQDALEVRGFELQARRNAWNSAANRCVYTIWRDPLSDLPVEVQFHTTASLEAQHLAMASAALINDPRIPSAETESLKSDIATTWAALPAPPGNSEISDYRRASAPATTDPTRPAVRQPDRSTP
jgi:hypothetical protein